MTAPAIGIVIPLFNKAGLVRRAIGSVLAQTVQDFEIIVVDDGSTDGSADAVQEIGDGRLRLVRQVNAGVSAARNRGIALARSPVVAFLDADDEWLPDHLASVDRMRQAFPTADVFATGYVVRTGAGADRVPVLRGLAAGDRVLIGDYFGVASRSDPPLFSSAVAATRRALDAIGGFPVGVAQGEDLLTWARLAARFQVAYARRPTAVFWQPEYLDGLPTRRPEECDRVGAALRALLDEVPPATRPSLRRYIAVWHQSRGAMFAALGERVAARAEFAKARAIDGPSPRLLAKSFLTVLPPQLAGWLTGKWRTVSRRSVQPSEG